MDTQENTQSHTQTSWVHLWLSVNGINYTVGVLYREASANKAGYHHITLTTIQIPSSFPKSEVITDSHDQLLLILSFCFTALNKLKGACRYIWSRMTGNILKILLLKGAFLKHFPLRFTISPGLVLDQNSLIVRNITFKSNAVHCYITYPKPIFYNLFGHDMFR